MVLKKKTYREITGQTLRGDLEFMGSISMSLHRINACDTVISWHAYQETKNHAKVNNCLWIEINCDHWPQRRTDLKGKLLQPGYINSLEESVGQS